MGNMFGKADSLWFRRKREERVSSSGSREKRGGAKVSSDPVRRGVKEGNQKKMERRGHYGVETKVGEGLRKMRTK